MFDNFSQGLFSIGAFGYLILVPVLHGIASLFMAVSIYKLLKARGDNHKFLWMLAVWASPIGTRVCFEIYRRFMNPKKIGKVKRSVLSFWISVGFFLLSVFFATASIVSLGAGIIKSEIDGEPLSIFYDVYGNEYEYTGDVPLYDQQGNKYTYQAEWFTIGNYVTENGEILDGNCCYLSEDGWFYYDKNNELKQSEKLYYDYYTDGEKLYYALGKHVYWERDGSIYEVSGKYHLRLFDFDGE